MADPASMGAASLAANGVSGLLGAMGAKSQADASAASFQYKAGIAQLNQQIAKQNQAYAINAGGIKAVNAGLHYGQTIADTKVKQGTSGLDVNSGSAVTIRDNQSDVARFDQGQIMADARRQEYGYEVEEHKQIAEESMDKAAASNAQDAGKLAVLSSIIGTAGSVASKWTQGNTIGMWSGGAKGSNATDGIGGYGPTAPSWST